MANGSACKTGRFIVSTIHAQHIEPPEKAFLVRVLRAPCFNVIFRPAQWETWRVLAQTAEGAQRIARYHFYLSTEFELVNTTGSTV